MSKRELLFNGDGASAGADDEEDRGLLYSVNVLSAVATHGRRVSRKLWWSVYFTGSLRNE